MDISEPACGSSHLAEKLYLLHQQPGRTTRKTVNARFHCKVNGVRISRQAVVRVRVPNTCALEQTTENMRTCRPEQFRSQSSLSQNVPFPSDISRSLTSAISLTTGLSDALLALNCLKWKGTPCLQISPWRPGGPFPSLIKAPDPR